MTKLRVCYPQRVSDTEHWKGMVLRYYEILRDRDPGLVEEVITGAWRQCPSFFPSIGELDELYLQASKRRGSESTLLQLEDQAGWSPEGAAKARRIVEELSGKLGAT